MNAGTAFKLYWGINLHMTTMDYSMLEYGANTKSANSKFESLSSEQRYRFEWLSTKYPDTQDMVYAMLGCQLDEINVPYDNREEIVDSYYKFRRRRDTLGHVLKKERLKDELSGFIPTEKIIFKYLVGEYSPEYMLLRDHNKGELLKLYHHPNYSWNKTKLLKLMKYSSFFNINKYLHVTESTEIYA